jgi:hypothetical protein
MSTAGLVSIYLGKGGGMNAEQVLMSAIDNKISLEVMYQGHARIVCPCRLGWKTTEKNGLHKNFFCYQIGGYSRSGLKPDGSVDNFRCWNLEEIRSALPVNAPWYCPQAWLKGPSQCIDDVIAEVKI